MKSYNLSPLQKMVQDDEIKGGRPRCVARRSDGLRLRNAPETPLPDSSRSIREQGAGSRKQKGNRARLKIFPYSPTLLLSNSLLKEYRV